MRLISILIPLFLFVLLAACQEDELLSNTTAYNRGFTQASPAKTYDESSNQKYINGLTQYEWLQAMPRPRPCPSLFFMVSNVNRNQVFC